MIAGSLTVTEPFDVEPPSSQSEGAHEPDSLVVLMGHDGRFALNNAVLSELALLTQVKAQVRQQPQPQITLKADGQLPGNLLVRFTQALHEAGVKKLRLLTLPEEV